MMTPEEAPVLVGMRREKKTSRVLVLHTFLCLLGFFKCRTVLAAGALFLQARPGLHASSSPMLVGLFIFASPVLASSSSKTARQEDRQDDGTPTETGFGADGSLFHPVAGAAMTSHTAEQQAGQERERMKIALAPLGINNPRLGGDAPGQDESHGSFAFASATTSDPDSPLPFAALSSRRPAAVRPSRWTSEEVHVDLQRSTRSGANIEILGRGSGVAASETRSEIATAALETSTPLERRTPPGGGAYQHRRDADTKLVASSVLQKRAAGEPDHNAVGWSSKAFCPGSPAKPNRAMSTLQVVIKDQECETVISEITARVEGKNDWKDPHGDGGTYSLYSAKGGGAAEGEEEAEEGKAAENKVGAENKEDTAASSSSFAEITEEIEKATVKFQRTGTGGSDKKLIDLGRFYMEKSGKDCVAFGCSETQTESKEDQGTNFCNLHNLVCGSKDGCKVGGSDFDIVETVIEYAAPNVADPAVCVGKAAGSMQKPKGPVVVRDTGGKGWSVEEENVAKTDAEKEEEKPWGFAAIGLFILLGLAYAGIRIAMILYVFGFDFDAIFGGDRGAVVVYSPVEGSGVRLVFLKQPGEAVEKGDVIAQMVQKPKKPNPPPPEQNPEEAADGNEAKPATPEEDKPPEEVDNQDDDEGEEIRTDVTAPITGTMGKLLVDADSEMDVTTSTELCKIIPPPPAESADLLASISAEEATVEFQRRNDDEVAEDEVIAIVTVVKQAVKQQTESADDDKNDADAGDSAKKAGGDDDANENKEQEKGDDPAGDDEDDSAGTRPEAGATVEVKAPAGGILQIVLPTTDGAAGDVAVDGGVENDNAGDAENPKSPDDESDTSKMKKPVAQGVQLVAGETVLCRIHPLPPPPPPPEEDHENRDDEDADKNPAEDDEGKAGVEDGDLSGGQEGAPS
ncbi:unnamed protein product [Amoebophrya sp. A120]|nr:unnamed protein product [Amoebophrya sp. A120]|eukprot:GSA120T00015198001.1